MYCFSVPEVATSVMKHVLKHAQQPQTLDQRRRRGGGEGERGVGAPPVCTWRLLNIVPDIVQQDDVRVSEASKNVNLVSYASLSVGTGESI